MTFDFSTTPTAKPAMIEAAHLSGLAANEGAAGLFAGVRDALDDSGDLLGVELADGEVVEEEERLSTLDEDVVDAHGNGVLADRVVLVEHEGQAQLRADAVGAGDEHRLLVLAGIQRKETAEAAEVAEDLRTIRRLDAVLDEFDGVVASIDVDAGILIGKLFCHFAILGPFLSDDIPIFS